MIRHLATTLAVAAAAATAMTSRGSPLTGFTVIPLAGSAGKLQLLRALPAPPRS